MMMLVDTHEDPQYELKAIQALRERRVDGILIAPTADPEQRTLNYLRDHQARAVLVDRLVGSGFDQVAVERLDATKELLSHVIGLGHRRIGFVSGVPGWSTTEDRLQGYRAALESAGIAFDAELVRNGQSACETARQATHELLVLDQRPTAIMKGNNQMTIGALRALRDAQCDC